MRKLLFLVLAAVMLGGCSVSDDSSDEDKVPSVTIKNNSWYIIKIIVLDYYNRIDNEIEPYPLKDSFELKEGESYKYTLTDDTFFFTVQYKYTETQDYEYDNYYASKVTDKIEITIENNENPHYFYKLIFPDSWSNFRPK